MKNQNKFVRYVAYAMLHCAICDINCSALSMLSDQTSQTQNALNPLSAENLEKHKSIIDSISSSKPVKQFTEYHCGMENKSIIEAIVFHTTHDSCYFNSDIWESIAPSFGITFDVYISYPRNLVDFHIAIKINDETFELINCNPHLQKLTQFDKWKSIAIDLQKNNWKIADKTTDLNSISELMIADKTTITVDEKLDLFNALFSISCTLPEDNCSFSFEPKMDSVNGLIRSKILIPSELMHDDDSDEEICIDLADLMKKQRFAEETILKLLRNPLQVSQAQFGELNNAYISAIPVISDTSATKVIQLSHVEATSSNDLLANIAAFVNPAAEKPLRLTNCRIEIQAPSIHSLMIDSIKSNPERFLENRIYQVINRAYKSQSVFTFRADLPNNSTLSLRCSVNPNIWNQLNEINEYLSYWADRADLLVTNFTQLAIRDELNRLQILLSNCEESDPDLIAALEKYKNALGVAYLTTYEYKHSSLFAQKASEISVKAYLAGKQKLHKHFDKKVSRLLSLSTEVTMLPATQQLVFDVFTLMSTMSQLSLRSSYIKLDVCIDRK